MSDPAVTVEALTVRRGSTTVLADLHCRFGTGRITGLLGPSGAGKTTLLRVIAGVQQIADGKVTVFGLPAGAAELRTRQGYMTQAAAVYADLSVEENVRYFATLAGAPRSRVTAVLADLDLTRLHRRPVHHLSGGQRSRVSLACALVGDPDLLILDEPTVGLDPLLREDIWELLRAKTATGVTVLLSSHVMDEAGRCDDLLLIRDGAVIATGTPAEIAADAGTPDMDAAFVTLIRRAQQEVSS